MSQTPWSNILNLIQYNVKPQEFNMWIRPLQAIFKDGCIDILSPNHFVQKKVLTDYKLAIETAIETQFIDKLIPNIFYKIGTNELSVIKKVNRIIKPSELKPTSIIKTSILNPYYQIDNYVSGKHNQLAISTSMNIIELDTSFNPFYIYGKPGAGKTHLVQAIANRITDNKDNLNICFVRYSLFIQNMVDCLKLKKIEVFKDFYKNLDLLIIDDFQSIKGAQWIQGELLNIVNELVDNDRQVILTSDSIVQEIQGLPSQLMSRISGGISIPITEIDLSTKIKIVKLKAKERKLLLDKETRGFIAHLTSTDIRTIEGSLNKLSINSIGNNSQSITLDLARLYLKEELMANKYKLNIPTIQRIASEYFQVSITDIISSSKKRRTARARQMSMTLAKEFTDLSLNEIALGFGGKNHTTVYSAHKKIMSRLNSDPHYKADFDAIKQQLLQ